ncbi:43260_t:CDS:2, partial [Gigaspora margarita]
TLQIYGTHSSTNIIEPEPTPDMSIQVEQTTERETAQDPIKKMTQDTNPLQGENAHKEYKQRKANLIVDNGKEEYDYAPTPDTEIDNVRIIMNNMEEQIQVTIECPNEEEYQATMDIRALNTKDKLVAQHDNSRESTTPIYMQGNEDLRDELNTLSFTNNSAAQNNEHVEHHTLETANKATQPGDAEWQLQKFDYNPGGT